MLGGENCCHGDRLGTQASVQLANTTIEGQRLTQVGKPVDSAGVNPVHATISSDGNALVVANYHGPDDVCNSTGSGVASFTIVVFAS